ncbi:MAG: hypothetical protein PHP02_07030 [Eubacteriales bacterium]|nr:hypothetical protein [Eubacteriales bacterium]
MAAKLRKTLGNAGSPWIVSLKMLIDTPSKDTVARWCLDFTEAHILPVFERRCPGDGRPRLAIMAGRSWFQGRMKLPQVKDIILNQCHAAARELGHDPAAQAAARACGHAASCCHTPGHSLGLAFYGAAAIAYDRVGLEGSAAVYEAIAAEVCEGMEAALRAVV